MLKLDVICDHSQQDLESVPIRVLEMCNLQMLYLEGNAIEYLPDELFTRLPKLNWLDIRNNKLKEIPASIANHDNLENLLLEHNQLEKLPNELGLVPKLVVLQLGKNPLTYPKRKIIEKGTQAICTFLKREYNKEHGLPYEEPSEETVTTDESRTTISKSKPKKKRNISVRELLRRASSKYKLQAENIPTISIRSLSAEPLRQQKYNQGDDKGDAKTVIVLPVPRKPQKITRYCSKLSVRSHYNSNKYVGVKRSRSNEQRVADRGLKEVWMNKLRELLTQQEKSLQQERNLQALSSWRTKKKLEPPREAEAERKVEVPYDTDPDYDRMMSRKDLSKDVEKFERILRRRKHGPRKNVDMQKLIDELMSQLKSLEASTRTDRTQDSDLQKSEKEIKKLFELHKRVTELQQKNQNTW